MTDPAGVPDLPPMDVGNPFLDLAAASRLAWWSSPQWPDRAGLTVRTGSGTLTVGFTLEDLQGFIAAAMAVRDQLAATTSGIIVANGNLDALRRMLPPPGGPGRDA